MRIRILILLFLLPGTFTYAQDLYQVSFSGSAILSSFSFKTDQDIIIKISPEGKVLAWGMEWEKYRYDYYPGKLQPYMGRVEYYGTEADTISKGKVKSIGTSFITYYPASETAAKAGKLKSIGRLQIDYFDNYENPSLRGKIKSAGYILFNYYSSFENESIAGKLKSAGNTPLTYYTSFEDKLVRGKIKSIGTIGFSWYPSTAATGYQGALKSGSYTQVVNAVTYILLSQ